MHSLSPRQGATPNFKFPNPFYYDYKSGSLCCQIQFRQTKLLHSEIHQWFEPQLKTGVHHELKIGEGVDLQVAQKDAMRWFP